MELPTPGSSGSTTRTVAPDVISDWASVSWVESLPWAFWMIVSELLSPAAANALVRYGASNSVYRDDVTVSGRITATLPLPADVTDLRLAMVVKSLVNVVTDTVAPPQA